ncbi:MAG TPA: TlpA disulfide reductase family protein [Acidimicrobiales bacterium]
MNNEMEPNGAIVVGDDTLNASKNSPPRRRLKRRWLVALIVATAVVAFAIFQGVTSPPSARSNVLTGRTNAPAIAFSLPILANPSDVLSLATFKGQPLVINFWASWCVPCRTEMPLLEKAYRSEGGKVAFLGVDTNDSPGAARSFLMRVHVAYPVTSDPNGSLAGKYGLFGLPTTIFISSNGKVVGRHIGQFYANTLKAALREAFGK